MRKTQESLNISEFKKEEPKISSESGEKKEISVEGKEGRYKLEKKKKKKKERKRLAKGILNFFF